MHFSQLLLAAQILPLSASAQTILGVYIFSRHGDRTAKAPGSSHLTNLGYEEIFQSGSYYRSRYIASGSALQIANISTSQVKLSQLSVSAPLDNVLNPSAQGFLQGLYPPSDTGAGGVETLHNGTNVTRPLGGFQLIPIAQTASGTGSEDQAWLQGSSNCANAVLSSNDYFASEGYSALLGSTMGFYKGLSPMVNGTFGLEQLSFKNAYTIFDLLNVANIDNATFPSQNLTPDVLFQLRTLADNHEFNLAYNASEPVRAISGATLAAQIVAGLNSTITSKGATKLTIQFGAYGSFQSFFGLANLTEANADFYGIPDYASTMVFELYSEGNVTSFPSTTDLRVRFLFHNGTTNATSEPAPFPLFGGSAQNLSWAEFTSGMANFSIGDQKDWCSACGNTTGVCSSASLAGSDSSDGSSSSSSSSYSNGISPTIGGVIGAMVTLAVILGAEALILLVGGYRVVSKRRFAQVSARPKA